MIKIAKWLNLTVGALLVAVVISTFVTLGFINVFSFTLTVFEGIFGMLIMLSSCNLKLIKENFLFLLTGTGKGLFNIFVGSLLFIVNNQATLMQTLMGIGLCVSGLIFLFLSCWKNVSDEELQRAVSVNTKVAYASVQEVASDNREALGKVAYDNRDLIMQVAVDNKEVAAQVAYENRDTIGRAAYNEYGSVAQEYVRND